MRKTACMGTCFVHAAGFASTVADASKLQSYQEDESKRFHVIRKSFSVFFWLKTNKNLAKFEKQFRFFFEKNLKNSPKSFVKNKTNVCFCFVYKM